MIFFKKNHDTNSIPLVGLGFVLNPVFMQNLIMGYSCSYKI